MVIAAMSLAQPMESDEIPSRIHRPDLRKTGIHPDYWYPLARSKNLKPGKSIDVCFAGEPIVLVRTESGSVFALEDRCAHRQVPLHAGTVRGEHLQCCYHGWTYDATGRCIDVPYLDEGEALPKGVRGYPCRESYGLIFVFPGDVRKIGDKLFPDIRSFDDPNYKTRYLDRRIDCHYSFMHENLMDMNHQFLHRRLMGRIQTILLEHRTDQGRIEVDYTFGRTGGRQPIGEKLMLGKRRLPAETRNRDLMTICTDYPYQTLSVWFDQSEHPALDLWNVYVPVDRAQRVNHTFGLMMIRKPTIPGLINLYWPFIIWFTEGIFAEDRWVVEQEQKAFDLQGADWNHEISPVILGLRKVLIEQGLSPTDG